MTDFREPSDGPPGYPEPEQPTTRPTGPWTRPPQPTVTAPTRTVPPPPPVADAPRLQDNGPAAELPLSSPEPAGRSAASTAWRAAKSVIKYAVILAVGYAILVAVLIVAYRWINPPATTLMLAQRAGGTPITRTWMPLERISPNLVRAVIMSEDARFCTHNGIDWREIEEAFERAQDGIPRGGSTISMQVAKNLFLWPSKTYVRKALEIPETLAMEALWNKRRMLEIYLNIAEWGPGVFGAEAAAQYHFRKPAIRLTEAEAALLAVALPNPILREAGRPGPGMQRLAQIIQGRMRGAAPYVRCILG